MRVAGGWVRDKMLGRESNDIDIALDDMTGQQFGELVAKKLNVKLGVVKANDEMSKHLETAIVRIEGQSIDLVNLRGDDWAGDADQTDTTIFGTPQIDASRRDLTINSLFYNIN